MEQGLGIQPNSFHGPDTYVKHEPGADGLVNCHQLEMQLLDAVKSIPARPESAWQIYLRLRRPDYSLLSQQAGEETVESRLQQEFQVLQPAQIHELEQQAIIEHSRHVENLIKVVKQEGTKYLKMCSELNREPHNELVPVIYLSVHAAACALHEPTGPTATTVPARPRVDENTGQARILVAPPEELFVEVVCNNIQATLHPATCRVRVNGQNMSATQFEQHAGCASAKKWRASLKLVPGQVPECPEGAPPMQIGKWFEAMGWFAGTTRKSSSRKQAIKREKDFN